MVKGTKVIKATSLVMSMEAKKGSRTKIRLKSPIRLRPVRSLWQNTAKTLHSCSPATTAIRQNKRLRTFQSKYAP